MRADGIEAPTRYQLPGGTVALPTIPLYLRTLVGAALWLGAPAAAMRALARAGARRPLHRLERWWARRVADHLDIDLDIGGLEQIDVTESYLVVPLHEGLADALVLLQLPLDLRFAVRDEIFDWRLVGPYLRDSGQILISPERGLWSYRQLLRTAPGVFETGESLVIFPQGSVLGIEIDFMGGAFALARAMHRPILPVVLTGTHCIWELPYTPRLRYGQRVSLRVLPPISVETQLAMGTQRLQQRVQRQMKGIALSGELAPPRRFDPARDGYWDGFAYEIDPAFETLAADVTAHRETAASSPSAGRAIA